MPDPAVELAFGLGDVGVPGPDDHVGRDAVEQAEGHRGERLDAAEREDALGAGAASGVEHRRVRRALRRRRGAGDDVRDTGHRRHPDRHERAGEQREPAGRQVGTDGARPARSAGRTRGPGATSASKSLQPVALHPGEPAGPLGAGVEGLAQVGGKPVGGAGELGGARPRSSAGPAVERLGVLRGRRPGPGTRSSSISETVGDTRRDRAGRAVSAVTGSLTTRTRRRSVLVRIIQVHTHTLRRHEGRWQESRAVGRASVRAAVALRRPPGAGGGRRAL